MAESSLMSLARGPSKLGRTQLECWHRLQSELDHLSGGLGRMRLIVPILKYLSGRLSFSRTEHGVGIEPHSASLSKY